MAAERLLFHHCKQGNLTEVQRVVELKDVNLNVRDCWDSTPLYYACLCGHKEIVEYLLQNGAKCEASTFDGERCLYGALTNDIRKMLQNWKQIHSTVKRRDRHFEILRHMFEEDKTHKDIVFDVNNIKMTAHRCVLAARSPFFSETLSTKWLNKETAVIKNGAVNVEAFHAMLQFLYLGRVDIKSEIVEDLKRLANYCQMSALGDEIQIAEKKLAKLVELKPSMSHRVKILTIESETSFSTLANDLRQLAESTFPVELRSWIDEGVLPFSDTNNNALHYPDIAIEVGGYRFLCHKVFLCEQSDYFKALITDHFNESEVEQPTSLPSIKLRHITVDILRHILIYVYSGRTEFQSLDEAMDVLTMADMMLLHGLKRACGSVLAQCLNDANVVDMFRCSHAFDLPNLEDRCTTYMAQELESLLESDDFVELVMEEAFSLESREETDSIPIVDDIRCCITSSMSTMSQIEEANAKLARLDAMLSRLGIEC